MSEAIGEALFEDVQNKTLTITKPLYKEKEQKLFVNVSLYFDKVSKEVWEYKIGGYQVLDKYLKSHKNEQINFEYFSKIIQSLAFSLEKEKQIAQIKIFE